MPTTAEPLRRRSGTTSLTAICGYLMAAVLALGAMAFMTAGAAVETIAEEQPTEELPGIIGGWQAAADILTIIGYIILGIAVLYMVAGYYVARMKIIGWVLMLVLAGTFMSASLVGRNVSPSNLSLWLNLVIVVLLLMKNTRHDCNIGRPPDPTIDEIMYQATNDMTSAGTSVPMPGYNTPGAGYNMATAFAAVPLDPESQERHKAAMAQTSTMDPTYDSPHEKAVWDHGARCWVLWDKPRMIFHRHDPQTNEWIAME